MCLLERSTRNMNQTFPLICTAACILLVVGLVLSSLNAPSTSGIAPTVLTPYSYCDSPLNLEISPVIEFFDSRPLVSTEKLNAQFEQSRPLKGLPRSGNVCFRFAGRMFSHLLSLYR